jgi:hypothetical protein
MTADCLLLDAKQAILDEQLQRWQALHQAGRREEANRQCRATLACATDLLNEALSVLQTVLEEKARRAQIPPSTPDAPPPA